MDRGDDPLDRLLATGRDVGGDVGAVALRLGLRRLVGMHQCAMLIFDVELPYRNVRNLFEGRGPSHARHPPRRSRRPRRSSRHARLGTVLPYQYAYAASSRGWGTLAAAAASSLFSVGALFAAPLGGRLADRVSPVRVAVVAKLVAARRRSPCWSPPRPLAFLAAMLVFGAGITAAQPAQAVLILRWVGSRDRRKVFAWQFTASSVGMALGALLAPRSSTSAPAGMAPAFTSRPGFVGSAVLIALAGRVPPAGYRRLSGARVDAVPSGRSGARGFGATLRTLWAVPGIRWVAVVTTLVTLGFYAQFESGLPAYALLFLDVPERTIGIAAAVNCLVIVALQMVVVRWTARRDAASLLVVVGVIWVACWVVMAFARPRSPEIAAVLFVTTYGIFAVGETLFAPVLNPLTASLAPAGWWGRRSVSSRPCRPASRRSARCWRGSPSRRDTRRSSSSCTSSSASVRSSPPCGCARSCAGGPEPRARRRSRRPVRRPWASRSAEDRGFEPLRAFTQHAFQACALGHYANPPPGRLSEVGARPRNPVGAVGGGATDWADARTDPTVAGLLLEDLPREGKRLLSTVIVDFIGNGLVLPFNVVYLHEVRGFELAHVGFLLSIPALVGLLVVGPIGALIDRIGARVVIVCACSSRSRPRAPRPDDTEAIGRGGMRAARLLRWRGLAGDQHPHRADHPERHPTALLRAQLHPAQPGHRHRRPPGGLFVDVHRPETFVAIYVIDAATYLAPLAILLGPLRHVSGRVGHPETAVAPGRAAAVDRWRLARRVTARSCGTGRCWSSWPWFSWALSSATGSSTPASPPSGVTSAASPPRPSAGPSPPTRPSSCCCSWSSCSASKVGAAPVCWPSCAAIWAPSFLALWATGLVAGQRRGACCSARA